MKTPRLIWFPLVAAACALMACSDDAPPSVSKVQDCATDDDCGAFEICAEGECVLVDAADATDDTTPPPLEDAEESDVEDAPRTGDPCDEGADCPSGFCIEVAGGTGQRICTEFCNPNTPSTCPTGFVCAAVSNTGADRTFLCFPEADILCRACEENGDCGGLSDLCLEYPDGRFCGRSCQTRDCPEGYDCVEVEGPEGASRQCRAEVGFCSACFDIDGDSFGEGFECLGLDCDDRDPARYEGADELCDEQDDDCDEVIDEGFDLQADPSNCGRCGAECFFDGAEALCVEGLCALGPCRPDRHDIDRSPDNGCELFCTIENEGVELCNDLDEDCDGEEDEGFELLNDPANCGRCGRACDFPDAIAGCQDGECFIDLCEPLHYDINRDLEDGCEYICLITQEGQEVCDQIDNNCDGAVDEGFDVRTDNDHCGRCGNACEGRPNRTPVCLDGQCGAGQCDEGFFDADGRDDNGCEYACERQNLGREACNGVDDDCDGEADEGLLNACGLCGPTPAEVCDGIDNDCDGGIDEGLLNACGLCGPTLAEVCDGIDNDCDGDIDEGLLNACGLCGALPAEVCDGIDNDCDGDIDESLLNACGQCGPTPTEVCNTIDDDCDGQIDEGLLNACGLCGAVPVEVCDGNDNNCDGQTDEGLLNACGQCGELPVEVCDGIDNDCDGTVDEGVCGAYIQSRCRLFVGWADNNQGPSGASTTWETCPAGDRDNSGDVRCVGTRRDGRFARLQLPGDVDGNDRVAVALLCDDDNNAPLAAYLQTHCAAYIGHADNNQGVDGSPAWGDCPPATSGDNGRQRCTSSGFDGRFRGIRLAGDVDGNDQLGVAWICRDDADPRRAAAMTASARIFLGWADNNNGPADGSTTWGPCPNQPSGDLGAQRCSSTLGDGLFRRLQLDGNVDDNDQLGWALRAR